VSHGVLLTLRSVEIVSWPYQVQSSPYRCAQTPALTLVKWAKGLRHITLLQHTLPDVSKGRKDSCVDVKHLEMEYLCGQGRQHPLPGSKRPAQMATTKKTAPT